MQYIQQLVETGSFEQAYVRLLPMVAGYKDTPSKMPKELRVILAQLIKADLEAGNISTR